MLEALRSIEHPEPPRCAGVGALAIITGPNFLLGSHDPDKALPNHWTQAYFYNNAYLSQNVSGMDDTKAGYYNNGFVSGNRVGGVEARNEPVFFI